MVLRFREELTDLSMDRKFLSFGILFGALLFAPDARSQYSYTYSYGNSRVVDQGQIGLPNPSGTYIGTGTLSKSAQGAVGVGAQVNPALPRVNHGAYVGTPGDNLYGANPINAQEPQLRAQAQARAYMQQRAAILRELQQQQAQQKQQVQQEGKLYVPGQNLNTGNTGMMVYPNGNGTGTAAYQPAESTVDADPARPVPRRF